ncbi:hypothetical protein FRC11_014907 [Ceratobasidium sp. 423]|nr:hypothetical protein FRC11_014907 [Ceratobasidium sp. 423]
MYPQYEEVQMFPLDSTPKQQSQWCVSSASSDPNMVQFVNAEWGCEFLKRINRRLGQPALVCDHPGRIFQLTPVPSESDDTYYIDILLDPDQGPDDSINRVQTFVEPTWGQPAPEFYNAMFTNKDIPERPIPDESGPVPDFPQPASYRHSTFIPVVPTA